jgi:hypothetical protein
MMNNVTYKKSSDQHLTLMLVPELPTWPGTWQAPGRLPGQVARSGRILKF